MANVSDDMRRKISEAALTLFSRHGFQRTGMADVAREASASRGTVYLAFRDKNALFEHLAAEVVDGALAAATGAWRPDAGPAENIEATILAKDLPLFRLLHASPHGAELLAVDAELTRRHAERLDAEFAVLLAHRVESLRDVDLGAFGDAAGFGRFVAVAAAGLKHEARNETDYRDSVRRLALVTARAAMTR